MSGYKLTRPKTTILNQNNARNKNNKKNSENNFNIECKHIILEDNYSEPYLKFLANSKVNRKKTK